MRFEIFLLLCILSYCHAIKIPKGASCNILVTSAANTNAFPIDKKQGDISVKQEFSPRTLTDFQTRDSRQGFARKVYSIFSLQMLTTVLVAYTIMTNWQVANFLFRHSTPVMLASSAGSMAIVAALASNAKLRYTPPLNFALLGVHTVLQSIMLGMFSSMFDPQSVLVGAMHTLMAFLAITLYSFQPNPAYDLTTVYIFR